MSKYIKTELMLEQCNCKECGCVFYISQWLLEHQVQEQKEIYCPFGHTTLFLPDKPEAPAEDISKIKSENADLKTRLFQALHDAEQGEAKKIEDAKESRKRKGV